MQAATHQKRKGPHAELPNHTEAFERIAHISNRYSKLLELPLTYRKQTTAPRSNRYKILFISRRSAAPFFRSAPPATTEVSRNAPLAIPVRPHEVWRSSARAVTMQTKMKPHTGTSNSCPRCLFPKKFGMRTWCAKF